ncbi:MAG: ABC transporter ATP-binding protein [Lachnospiraceae bacterium]|nr:ABC transporter ATP-binding protein [Lachnospiraceae bacterium]
MNVLRRLKFVLSRRQKSRVLILVVLIFIGALFETLGVGIIIPLISVLVDPDSILGNEIVIEIMSKLGITELSRDLFVRIMLIATLAVFVLKNVYLLWMTGIQARFVANAQSETSVRLIYDCLNRPYEYYLNAESSDIMRTFHSDIPHVFELLKELMLLASEVVVSICICIFLMIVDFKMTMAIALLLAVMVLVIIKLMKPTLSRLGNERVSQQSKTMKWMQESIGGIKDVKVSAREQHFVEGFEKDYRRLAASGRRYTVLNAAPRLVIETVCIAGMLMYMFILVMRGADLMSMFPTLTAFAMAAVRLMPSVNRMSSHVSAITYYEPSLNVIADNLDVASLKEAGKGRQDTEKISFEKEIVLKDICYHYPNSDKQIFDRAEMRIPVGSSVGVMGPSGAGKTTIADILLGLLRPQEGRVFADGREVDPTSPGWLYNVGYIAQNMYMLDNTIRRNVAFGMNDEDIDDERVWEVLREAQMEDFVKGLPDGLDTYTGDKGIRISGGQRQRIGIARALYHDPELLVFDEATSALDNETEAAVMEAVNSLKGRKTMLIIAHRLKTIENCDIIYKVENKKITESSL